MSEGRSSSTGKPRKSPGARRSMNGSTSKQGASTNKTNQERRSIYPDESNNLRPLRQLFNDYAKLRSGDNDEIIPDSSRRQSKKSVLPDDSDGETNAKDESKITCFGVESWFRQAKIFDSPVCKMTAYDVRTLFSRTEKSMLTYREFEHFIAFLCQFRKVHTSTILLRLQLAGSKDLQEQVFHVTAPEGTVDRVVDAFRLEADNVSEQFVDLSKDPYEEPVCFGGIRSNPQRAHSPNSKRAEELELANTAKSIMVKGEETSKADPFSQNFIYYAKSGNYFSDGRSMGLTQLIKWMRQAGIIDGSNITSMDIGYLFKRLYSLNWRIYMDDLHQFLHELSMWKNIDKDAMTSQLQSCRPPASSSVSTITMSLPTSHVELLKKTMSGFSEEFEENREQYEPQSADTPFGHTPNSRNRHFKNSIEEDNVKVRSQYFEELKKGKGGEAVVLMAASPHGKKSIDGDEKEEVFSEEKRSGKDYNTKRWHDAYPIGGAETSHRGRIEADLEKLLFGYDRQDESSSDDEEKVKAKMLRAKYVLTNAAAPQTSMPSIPLEEQFEKYKQFGEHKNELGIELPNVELWFNLAGLITQLGTTMFTSKEVEDGFKEYKSAVETKVMDFETFEKYLEQLGEPKKKHINAKEIKERLSRCGPPRPLNVEKTSVSFNKEERRRSSLRDERRLSRVSETRMSMTEEEDDPSINAEFRTRFHEFARFGEPTVSDQQPRIHSISMSNADKWFRQAKLQDKGFNPGEVDVLFKQLYPNKQRLLMKELIKVLEALGQTGTQVKMTSEELILIFSETGPPEITEMPS